MSWLDGEKGASLFFLIFVGLGFYLLMVGTTEMDPHTITYTTRLGQYQIRWDEITQIEMDRGLQSLAFKGCNKRLAIPGPAYWSGKDRLQMFEFLGAQVERYRIATRFTVWSAFRRSKNTKVHL